MIAGIIETLSGIISQLGYIGILIGMTIESSFFPFPSEIILIPAGALVAQGEMSFFLVFLMALLGSIIGALINFAIAFFLGRKAIDALVSKYGKFLFINKKNIKKSDVYFEKHGEVTTFIGRLIPAIRQLISLPAGFSRMKLSKFIIFTGLGAGIWSLILIYIGYVAGDNLEWMHANGTYLTIALVLFALIVAAIYVIIKKNRR